MSAGWSSQDVAKRVVTVVLPVETLALVRRRFGRDGDKGDGAALRRALADVSGGVRLTASDRARIAAEMSRNFNANKRRHEEYKAKRAKSSAKYVKILGKC